MIGKVINGKSFGGCIRYCLDEKKLPEILDVNGVMPTETKSIIKQFNAIRKLRPGVSKVVWHAPISFAKTDPVDNDLMIKIAREYLTEMKLDQHQYLVVRHNDCEHPHMHLIANRIGFDGIPVDIGFNRVRTLKVMQRLEKEYNLTIARDQKNLRKAAIFKLAKQVNDERRSFHYLENEIKRIGYSILINKTKHGKLTGVSFQTHDGKITYKASQINRKLPKLLKEIYGGKKKKIQITL